MSGFLRYGINGPISVAGPTEADYQRNIELEKFLIDSSVYETKEEDAKREEVTGYLDLIVKAWVKELTRLRGYPGQLVEDANLLFLLLGLIAWRHMVQGQI